MTYKQIEASRELRLWLGQIVIPAVIVVASVPELRNGVVKKYKTTVEKIKRRNFMVVNKNKEAE